MTSMKKFLCCLLFLYFFYGCEEMPCDDNFERGEVDKEIIGFYSSFREKHLTIEDIPFQYLTRIIYAFAEPLEDGSLNVSSLKNTAQLVRYAHRNNVEVYFSVGGRHIQTLRSHLYQQRKAQSFCGRSDKIHKRILL